jgi:hypothetical protein
MHLPWSMTGFMSRQSPVFPASPMAGVLMAEIFLSLFSIFLAY